MIIINLLILSALIAVIFASTDGLTNFHISAPRNVRRLNVLIWAWGTRGDCQPMVNLAQILNQNGHRAIIAAASEHKNWIMDNGIEYWHYGANGQLVDEALDMMTSIGMANLKMLKGLKMGINYFNETFLEAGEVVKRDEARDIDLVMCQNWVFFCSNIAEYLRVPYIEAQFFTNTKTGDFDFFAVENSLKLFHSLFPWWSRGFSKASYDLADRAFSTGSIGITNRLRRSLGLRDISLSNWHKRLHAAPIIYAISPNVFPRPKDWSPHVHMVGYWIPKMSGQLHWRPSEELWKFLDRRNDKRPIAYFELGSMTKYHKTQSRMIKYLRSINRRNIRWIIATGPPGGELESFLREWSPARDESTIFLKKEIIPHTWLLPRIDVFIHHGGAGTCAAAYYAGIPSIIMPQMGDQVQNCDFADRNGVAICVNLHARKANLPGLVKKVLKIPSYRRNVQELSSKLNLEVPEETTMKAIMKELRYIVTTGNQFPGQYQKLRH